MTEWKRPLESRLRPSSRRPWIIAFSALLMLLSAGSMTWNPVHVLAGMNEKSQSVGDPPLERIDPDQAHDQALALLRGGADPERDDRTARRLLEQAAARGHVRAMHLLAWMHLEERGGGGDCAEVERLLLEAARLDDPESQNLLALLHGQGRCVPRDHQAMIHWLRAAARNGHPDAVNALNMLFLPPVSGQ